MTIVTSNDESVKNRIEVGNNVIYDKFGSTGMANVKARLPIKCAQPGDEGQYKCVAINRGKEVSATTYLSVIGTNPLEWRKKHNYIFLPWAHHTTRESKVRYDNVRQKMFIYFLWKKK